MSAADIIQAIRDGDATAIQQSFNQEMSRRVADRLDTMRTDVARNMFGNDSSASAPEAPSDTGTAE